jgi:mannose/cellobiose epimerase-like protein (N-acyl-D-glucosamine 2-epimerase family)
VSPLRARRGDHSEAEGQDEERHDEERPRVTSAPILTAPDEVRAAAVRLKRWLLEAALPIWWERGADHAGGGFFDRLGLDGVPDAGPKRVRVQARQAHVYALAASLGWTGPAKTASRHGLASLMSMRCGDGLYRPTPETIQPLDGMGLLYDQAFVLLALASDRAAFGDNGQEAPARTLIERVTAFAHPLGGFAEAPNLAEPLFANPNMHLFESLQAWTRLSDSVVWREPARGEARLALDQLIDPARGVLDEQFGPDWAPATAPTDRVVWPGHLYEWAFLLLDWPDADAAARAAALRLIEVSERTGVDARGVTMFALDAALAPLDPGARLWSQTERLRACARAAALTGETALWTATAQACGALEAFLDVPTRGLWRDRMEADRRFREEAAPASSLYHIVGAIAELDRAAGASA